MYVLILFRRPATKQFILILLRNLQYYPANTTATTATVYSRRPEADVEFDVSSHLTSTLTLPLPFNSVGVTVVARFKPSIPCSPLSRHAVSLHNLPQVSKAVLASTKPGKIAREQIRSFVGAVVAASHQPNAQTNKQTKTNTNDNDNDNA